MLTPETLARLEAAALKQNGLEFGTTVAVMPGELLELVRLARIGDQQERNPAYIVNMTSRTITKVDEKNPAGGVIHDGCPAT